MPGLGVLIAIVASTLLNVGKGIQKWKVKVLGQGLLQRQHRADATIWLIGVLMTVSASVGFSAALLLTDKPSTVAALNGVGLIGLVIFAHTVLHERVGLRELMGAVAVVSGTAVMGLFDVAAPKPPETSLGGLLVCGVAIVCCYTPLAIWSWRARRLHGLIFGSMSGTLVGMAMVLADLALVESGGQFLGQLAGGWVYLALLVGTTALALTQLAFWRAAAIVVVPTMNAFIVLAPLYIQYLVFDILLEPAQYAGMGIIVAGIVLLTARPAGPTQDEAPGSA